MISARSRVRTKRNTLAHSQLVQVGLMTLTNLSDESDRRKDQGSSLQVEHYCETVLSADARPDLALVQLPGPILRENRQRFPGRGNDEGVPLAYPSQCIPFGIAYSLRLIPVFVLPAAYLRF